MLLPLAESFFRKVVSRPGMAKTGVQRVVGGGGASKYRTNRLISADSAIWPRAKTPDLGPRARTPVRPPVCPLFTASQNCQKSLFYKGKCIVKFRIHNKIYIKCKCKRK